MADYRSLTLKSGVLTQIQDADSIVVGAGVKTAAGNLTITPAGTDAVLGAGKNLSALAGAGAVDLSLMTGLFKTPTGALTIGGAGGAATFASTSNTFSNALYADGGMDRSGAAALSIGTVNATGVTIGKVGATTTIAGNLQVSGTETVVGATTFQDNVTFGDAITDTVAFTARLVSDFIPLADNLRSFGTSALRFSNLHATTIAARADATDTSKSTLTATGLAAAGALSITTAGGGALTLTGAAASTWSTSAGVLTINAGTTVNLQGGGVTSLILDGANGTATGQAGVTLATTGTGNINLPQNASARFKVEGVATTAGVTAANLNTLTDGSDASALHTHSAAAATSTTFTATAGEIIAAGELVSMDAVDLANARVWKADANGAGELVNCVGVANNAAAALGAVTVIVAGERAVPDAEWDAVPVVADCGKRAYMSETAGNWTLTAPSTAGSTVLKTGILTVGGAGSVKIVVQIGEGTVL